MNMNYKGNNVATPMSAPRTNNQYHWHIQTTERMTTSTIQKLRQRQGAFA